MPTIKKDGPGAGDPRCQPDRAPSAPASDHSGAGVPDPLARLHLVSSHSPSAGYQLPKSDTPDGFDPTEPSALITVNQPVHQGVRSFKARLLGATFDRGSLLNYRVRDAQGVTWFVPQSWTEPTVDVIALEAGAPLRDLRPAAWVDRIRELQHRITGRMPA